MTPQHSQTRPFLNGWRIAGWATLAALLVLPGIAMRFTSEVRWTPSDFVFAAVLLAFLGGGIELACRVGRSKPQTAGLILATLLGFATVWINAAVGIIGNEDEAVNLGFPAMVALGIMASFAARFRPRAMRWITAALAPVPAALGIVATRTMPGHAVEWGLLIALAVLWLAASACFAQAVRQS